MENREIKFRAWDKKGEYMRYCNDIDYLQFFEDGEILIGIGDSKYSSRENPVMQYTGLKDKNGKEIFEGDILEKMNKQIAVVEYITTGTCFIARAIESHFVFKFVEKDEIAIIGNIYENPELIKKS